MGIQAKARWVAVVYSVVGGSDGQETKEKACWLYELSKEGHGDTRTQYDYWEAQNRLIDLVDREWQTEQVEGPIG